MKVKVNINGKDSNIYIITAIASRALKKNGLEAKAEEMKKRVNESASYNDALKVISEYCDLEL